MQSPSPLRTPLLLQLTPQLGLHALSRTCSPAAVTRRDSSHTYSHVHMHLLTRTNFPHIWSQVHTRNIPTCTPIHGHSNHTHALTSCAFSTRTLHKCTHIHSQSLHMYVLSSTPPCTHVAGAHPCTFTVRAHVFSHAHTHVPSHVRSRVHSTTTCSYTLFTLMYIHAYMCTHNSPECSDMGSGRRQALLLCSLHSRGRGGI